MRILKILNKVIEFTICEADTSSTWNIALIISLPHFLGDLLWFKR